MPPGPRQSHQEEIKTEGWSCAQNALETLDSITPTKKEKRKEKDVEVVLTTTYAIPCIL
jgi:hypothetical protein